MIRHHHESFGDPPPPDTHEVTDVRWRYVSDFHDGAISGMVTVPSEVDGQIELWAECCEECNAWSEADGGDDEVDSPCGFYRRYRLILLTSKAAIEQAERHDDFVTHVGSHWDFDEDGRRSNLNSLKPRSEHRAFYDKWPPKRPFVAEGEVVGWFRI